MATTQMIGVSHEPAVEALETTIHVKEWEEKAIKDGN